MPALAIFPWIVSLLGAVVSSVATWFIGRVVFERAIHYALITGFLIASAALFVALVVAVKTLILGARVAMPQTLGLATFFLPPSISQIFATIVTVRVSASVYRWTVSTMAAYLPANPSQGLMRL